MKPVIYVTISKYSQFFQIMDAIRYRMKIFEKLYSAAISVNVAESNLLDIEVFSISAIRVESFSQPSIQEIIKQEILKTYESRHHQPAVIPQFHLVVVNLSFYSSYRATWKHILTHLKTICQKYQEPLYYDFIYTDRFDYELVVKNKELENTMDRFFTSYPERVKKGRLFISQHFDIDHGPKSEMVIDTSHSVKSIREPGLCWCDICRAYFDYGSEDDLLTHADPHIQPKINSRKEEN